MTYLDDADHDWSIDPAARDYSASEVVEMLVTSPDLKDPATLALIMRGARELHERRPAESALDCLATSLVWYFG